jgi:cysteine synthase
MARSPSTAEALALPRFVGLAPNLHAAAFTLMKLVPARHILKIFASSCGDGAKRQIVETTSGTFGLALAIVCREYSQFHLTLVSDPVIDKTLAARLTELGARIDIVRTPAAVGGFQGARNARVDEYLAADASAFSPRQYENRQNPESYRAVAELVLRDIGQIDMLVGSVGSGGSMCGMVTQLRTVLPELRAVAVDTHGSVLFGQADKPRIVRGLGNSIMPSNVTHACFDEVHWLSANRILHATRLLHKTHGLFMGPTSGACFLVGSWLANVAPDARILVLMPDEGHRYVSTVYNDRWLRSQQVTLGSSEKVAACGPLLVEHPGAATSDWDRMQWQRRTLDAVLYGNQQA